MCWYRRLVDEVVVLKLLESRMPAGSVQDGTWIDNSNYSAGKSNNANIWEGASRHFCNLKLFCDNEYEKSVEFFGQVVNFSVNSHQDQW